MTDTEFSPSEVTTIQAAISGRWKNEEISTHLADLEIIKEEGQEDKTYPAVIWEASNSTFILVKTQAFTYKGFFYYAKEEQRYDTGVDQYHDLHECTSSLLKAQANFILAKSNNALSVHTTD